LVEEVVNQKANQKQKTNLSKAVLSKKLLNFSQVERLARQNSVF
jgi:hypothetical protein